MNPFADTLLSLVFGWLRRLVESLWTSVSSGRFRGALSWLGDHWLWLVLVLCIGCTVLDYLIWLLRWKPYVIWRNRLRRLFGKGGQPAVSSPMQDDSFRQGYEQGVDVDLSDMPMAPAPVQEEYFTWQQPSPPDAAPQPAPLFQGDHEAPMPAFSPPQEPLLPEQPLPRNRRSQRYEKRKFRLSGILPTANEEAESMLDGLPPAVNKEQAFHAPVYPGQYDKQG